MRHHHLHELSGFVEDHLVINEDFADVLAQVVAYCADDDITFLVNQKGG